MLWSVQHTQAIIGLPPKFTQIDFLLIYTVLNCHHSHDIWPSVIKYHSHKNNARQGAEKINGETEQDRRCILT